MRSAILLTGASVFHHLLLNDSFATDFLKTGLAGQVFQLLAFDRTEHANVEVRPRDHRPVVVKPNAGCALQQLGLNCCGG
jgi:hypothetical protein